MLPLNISALSTFFYFHVWRFFGSWSMPLCIYFLIFFMRRVSYVSILKGWKRARLISLIEKKQMQLDGYPNFRYKKDYVASSDFKKEPPESISHSLTYWFRGFFFQIGQCDIVLFVPEIRVPITWYTVLKPVDGRTNVPGSAAWVWNTPCVIRDIHRTTCLDIHVYIFTYS